MANKTIYPHYTRGEQDGVEVREWHTYPRSSVLAGQSQEVIRDFCKDVEEAKVKHPDAEVAEEGVGPSRHRPSVSQVAPSDFDPSYCGEHWGEDDY